MNLRMPGEAANVVCSLVLIFWLQCWADVSDGEAELRSFAIGGQLRRSSGALSWWWFASHSGQSLSLYLCTAELSFCVFYGFWFTFSCYWLTKFIYNSICKWSSEILNSLHCWTLSCTDSGWKESCPESTGDATFQWRQAGVKTGVVEGPKSSTDGGA